MDWIVFLLLLFRSQLFNSSKSIIIRKDCPLLTADQLSFVISLSECWLINWRDTHTSYSRWTRLVLLSSIWNSIFWINLHSNLIDLRVNNCGENATLVYVLVCMLDLRCALSTLCVRLTTLKAWTQQKEYPIFSGYRQFDVRFSINIKREMLNWSWCEKKICNS